MKTAGRIIVAVFGLALASAPGATFAEHGEQGATHEAGSAPKTAGELETAGEEHGEGAAHGEGHGAAPELDVKRLAFQVLNFAVLVFLLVKFGGPPVRKVLGARTSRSRRISRRPPRRVPRPRRASRSRRSGWPRWRRRSPPSPPGSSRRRRRRRCA